MKEKSKIIFSTYDDIHNPFYAGGGARAISEITKRLAKDFSITVITGNYKGAKNSIINDVVYKRIGPSFLGPKFGQLVFSLLLPLAVKKEQFDIWVESFTPPFSTAFLQKFTKKPVIGLVHMLASEDMERKYKLPFHIIENAGLKTYKTFIVLSETFKKKIRKSNKTATIAIIPNGIAEIKEVGLPQTEKYILFLGRLEFDQKGLDLLIDAYNLITTKVKTKLIIAGSGLLQDRKKIEKRIAELNLNNDITLVGQVDNKKKETLLKNCSLVVIPSRFETFGVVALEALAYGKPLVSFAIEGLEWIPNGAVWKVTPFDTKAFAEAMYTLLTDTQKRSAMREEAQKTVKEFSWENIVTQYTTLFHTYLT